MKEVNNSTYADIYHESSTIGEHEHQEHDNDHQSTVTTHNVDSHVGRGIDLTTVTDNMDSDESLKMRTLIQLYRNIDDSMTFSGGIQQYLNGVNLNSRTRNNGANSFDSLPMYVKLEILSYLCHEDLCRLATVSKLWNTVSNDDVLWNKRLAFDCQRWKMIEWDRNPLLYAQLGSDWSPKDIYARCCRCSTKDDHYSSVYYSLSVIFRSLLPKKTPRVAMFGPGIETSVSGIVKKILCSNNNLFSTIKMFPGIVDGLGSGFTIKVNMKDTIDLMILYSSTKRERIAVRDRNRMEISRLFQQNADITENNGYELTQSMGDLCHTLDAFIYVIGSSKYEATSSNADLTAMCNTRWSSIRLPVLVLSCVSDNSTPRRSAVDVVKSLDLTSFNRPWQVHDVEVKSMSGMGDAFHWLIHQANQR